MTKKYGILAFPAAHSLSPVMFNAAFKALNIDAQYGIFEVAPENLSDFMKDVLSENIHGLSVSLPHKEMIMKLIERISPDSQKIGAVNTVVNKGTYFEGHNTDFIGSNQALIESIGPLKDKKAVVIGAGGAARAIIYGLLKENAEVLIVNRSPEKGQKMVEEFDSLFGAKISAISHEEALKTFPTGDILIQATSIWTLKKELTEEEILHFCPAEWIANFDTVMDIIYRPLMTPLLTTAKKLGKKIITGEKMLLYQAAEQFKIWTGEKAPLQVMREALDGNLL